MFGFKVPKCPLLNVAEQILKIPLTFKLKYAIILMYNCLGKSGSRETGDCAKTDSKADKVMNPGQKKAL